jgi:hypothetical protein
MGLFRHPHRTRGVVETEKGRFVISRGLLDVPDEVGDAHGWERVETDDTMAGPSGASDGHVQAATSHHQQQQTVLS